MVEFTAADLAVVIPTRERWDVLGRTLSSLADQSVSGFEVIVVIDGTDQVPPPIDVNRVLVKRRAGPGGARNAGARATDRSLVMFLGDDTIPAADLVERHLATHCRHPESEAAAVGFVGWHPEVARNRINRWLEWSGTQTWYASLAREGEQEVSHWYFYTSNVSLKRELLLEGDGFDEDFPFAAFEDLECGLRLSRLGLHLYYEPAAICHHLHDYDWPAVERRFACMALSERLMVDKHPELEAGCLGRMKAAALGRALPLDRFVDIVPQQWKRLDRLVRRHVDLRYHRRLAPVYLEAWGRAAELCELRRYLGERYDSARLVYSSERPQVKASSGTQSESEGPSESEGTDDERLFDYAGQALAGTTDHALSLLQHQLPPGSRVLEYGCGIGSHGLRLAQAGYSVQFADHPGAPLTYLRWRLADRGLLLPVYELGLDELPSDLDFAVCLDAAGPGRDPVVLLNQLEQVAPMVALGFFAEAQGSSPRPSVPVELLAARSGRSRLVARHELPGGSLMLLYGQHQPGPTTPDEPAGGPWRATEMRGRR
jgi:glycosyltransferase involved in cell wall biosynthesis